MNRKKKWMVTLEDVQYEWVRNTAADVKVTGSAIIQQLIDERRKAKDNKFKDSLISAQLRMRRQALEEQRESINAELRKLEGKDSRTTDEAMV